MFAGDLNLHQVDDLKRACATAEKESGGLKFSTYVGETEGDAHAEALSLLGKLDDPAGSVLVLCDPDSQVLEIVTGSEARRWLNDHECSLAAATMASSFAAGDIAGGLAAGILQLGRAAHHPPVLHASKF
ncbi:hypothetical protein GCM10027418_20780 [Mariniluteicoccus endophyticus]